jgi:hypothetical protein
MPGKRGKKVVRAKYEIGKKVRLYDALSESAVEGILKSTKKEDGFLILVVDCDGSEMTTKIPTSLAPKKQQKEGDGKKKSKSKTVKLIVGSPDLPGSGSKVGVMEYVGVDELTSLHQAAPLIEGRLVGMNLKNPKDKKSPVILFVKSEELSRVESSDSGDGSESASRPN